MARTRSPNYPAISLRQAVEQIRKVYSKEHNHKASADVVVKAMGYGGLNGASMTVLSALKKYGLLEEVGEDFKVSKAALTILVDPSGSKERAAALEQAAFSPALFAELQKEYGRNPPSDENMRAFLLKRGFHPDSVAGPIKAYRDTLLLLSEQVPPTVSGQNSIENGANQTGSDPNVGADQPKVGDFVQWLVNDSLQFQMPKRVRAVRQHDGSDWVFVDGSETGIPMEQVTIEQPGIGASLLKVPPVFAEEIEAARTLPGEREWLRGPLSKRSGYRLIVSGDLGPKEIGKLIKLLEAQKAVLSDEDEEDATS